jgi:hypothetical protein
MYRDSQATCRQPPKNIKKVQNHQKTPGLPSGGALAGKFPAMDFISARVFGNRSITRWRIGTWYCALCRSKPSSLLLATDSSESDWARTTPPLYFIGGCGEGQQNLLAVR